jgi:hypothetical protein
MQTTRKIAARVSGPTTVCGRTISFNSLGVSMIAISLHDNSDPSAYSKFAVINASLAICSTAIRTIAANALSATA